MASSTVLVIGCGVAGPVLAILLKRKGYNPIVFEKVRELGNAGASLMLMPNGLKVLDLVGLADAIKAESLPLSSFWDAKATGEVLGQSDLPSTFTKKYFQPAIGIKRTTLNLMLKKTLLDLDVDVREGWELIDIQEEKSSVTAIFNNGRSATGSFLVGCDGTKSASRAIILKNKRIQEGAPVFTGLAQTACISATPEALRNTAAMRNWYGDGVHVISYPVSASNTSWAITRRETKELAETWRPYRPDEMATQREGICEFLKGWDPNVLRMAKSAERIIKFGLFDREELKPDQWYSKRCVLVGDAAHPTSPHLGQGANQALEDCYHLDHAMPSLTPGAKDHEAALQLLRSHLSESVFHRFAEKRQPRTSMLVSGARAQGEKRVATGRERCEERNQAVIRSYEDNASALASKFDELLGVPFQ